MIAPPPARRVFELLLSYDCNAKCGFCYNPPLTPDLLSRALTFERAALSMSRARAEGHDGVWLTGGEPTLRADLPKLLLLARKLGFRRVQIGTNGVRLASAARARRLASAGLNYARVSLHGARAATHDGLLKLPGSFDKALRAVENLRGLGVAVGLNFVVTRPNAAELPAFFELALGTLGLRDFDVIFLHRRGMMDLSEEELGLRYREAAPYLRAAWAVQRRHGLRRRTPSIVNVPPCVFPELEAWISDWSSEEGADSVEIPAGPARDLIAMKGAQKVKGSACARCALESRCLGFEREYARLYGESEFVPIGALSEAAR